MRVVSLQSGSNGNCYYVESGGVSLLVDAGLSAKQVLLRLAASGLGAAPAPQGVLISHDHSDHVRCAGIYHRKFAIPIYATQRTFQAACNWSGLGQITDVRHFDRGATLEFGPMRVLVIPTPHDGCDPAAFVIDDGRRRLGILTDLGHAFEGLGELIASLDAVVLESNYDPGMLERGPYPLPVKRRIVGPAGHLSNIESAELLRDFGSRLNWACLAHLSKDNNTPALAMRTHRAIIGHHLRLHLAGRYAPSEVLEV